MILQALYRLAMDENLMADPDYEMKPVAWLVRVDRDGRLLGIESTKSEPPEPAAGKRKPKPVAKQYSVPRESSRTSGDRAFLLFDKAEYVFGLDPLGERDAETLKKRAALFRDRVRECRKATSDEAVTAVLKFLDDLATGRQAVKLDEQAVSNDLFAFIYAPDIDTLVTARPAVREYWKGLRRETGDTDQAKVQCLVSGRACVPADKHPVIKNVPGGTTSGVSLVSFNSNAFESYGWARNENAPVSREAAEACSTALNRLLSPAPPDPDGSGRTLPRRNLRLSDDTTVCYWTGGQIGSELVDGLADILAGIDREDKPNEVKALYQSLWHGRASYPLDKDVTFYALTMSGAQGRAIVRDWFESTVKDVTDHLARHFTDLKIVRNTPKPREHDLPPAVPLGALLESLAPLGKRDKIPPDLASQLVNSALRGTAYPFSILQRALERTRAEFGRHEWADLQRRDARAALIKAVLNRRKRFHPQTTEHYQEVTEAMDQSNVNPGYLLGRLMAVIERVQQEALGDVNASVIDRFFAGASATPTAVFPRLLKNLRHHVRKARDDEQHGGTVRWLEGEVDQILARVPPPLPVFLNLEQQGLFVLGYHHERHWLWMSKADRQKLQESSQQPASV